MKISEITGRNTDVEFEINFDPIERDRFVSRFLAAFSADVDEDLRQKLVYDVHIEIRHQHDLYSAVFNVLDKGMCRAIRTYVSSEYRRLNGRLAYQDPEWFRPG